VNGFLENPTLRDYTHASKIFRTDAYGNAPKFKWLFHVYFEINDVLTGLYPQAFPNSEIPGLLVKNIQLPKYSIQLHEMNQYNRKRYIQTKINYDPVSVTFHDDNNNAIRKLWFNYYSYYYNDPSQPSGVAGRNSNAVAELNIKNTYNYNIEGEKNWGYLGEPSNSATAQAIGIAKAPFFKTVKVYGFNQHNFVQYTLINPVIEKFDHDTYDYSAGTGTMENRMTLRYESVKYAEGALNGQQPGQVVTGFGSEANYDRRPSPITRPGSTSTILGQGGLVEAGQGILNDLSKGDLLGALQKAGTTARTFKNPQNILQAAKSELVRGAIGAASEVGTRLGAAYVGSFPAAGAQTNTVSQGVAATNTGGTQAPLLSVPGNKPATTSPTGGVYVGAGPAK